MRRSQQRSWLMRYSIRGGRFSGQTRPHVRRQSQPNDCCPSIIAYQLSSRISCCHCRRQQMGIDEADAACKPAVVLDRAQDLLVACQFSLRQMVQPSQYGGTIVQASHRHFTANRRVPEHTAVPEQHVERGNRLPEMIDPDRPIDKNHAAKERRRGAASASGSLPPIAARRRDASHSTSILSPFRTTSPVCSVPA